MLPTTRRGERRRMLQVAAATVAALVATIALTSGLSPEGAGPVLPSPLSFTAD